MSGTPELKPFPTLRREEVRDFSVGCEQRPAVCSAESAVIQKLKDTYQEVKKAYDVVVRLRSLPHVDNFKWGWEREYSPSDWKGTVLPMVSGSTQHYRKLLEGAAIAYKEFAQIYLGYEEHDSMHCTSVDCVHYLDSVDVDFKRLPSFLKPSAELVTHMMAEIAVWQSGDIGRQPQIECEGKECPDDDEADAFSLFGKGVCYLSDNGNERYCYGDVFKPFGAYLVCAGLWGCSTPK